MNTPTNEPTSSLFDALAAAEARHNNTDKKLRDISECLQAAATINTIIEFGIEAGDITEADIDYDRIRQIASTLDIAVGEKTCRSADRHLIATYVCLIRNMPIPTTT